MGAGLCPLFHLDIFGGLQVKENWTETVPGQFQPTDKLDTYLSAWSDPDQSWEARENFRWNARRRLVDLICQRTPGLVGKRCISWIAQGLFERAISPAGPDSIVNKATTDFLEELLAPRDDWDTTWVCVINKIVQILRSDRVLIRELALDLFEMITEAPEDRYINRAPVDPSSCPNEDGCEWDTPPHDPEIDLPWWF